MTLDSRHHHLVLAKKATLLLFIFALFLGISFYFAKTAKAEFSLECNPDDPNEFPPVLIGGSAGISVAINTDRQWDQLDFTASNSVPNSTLSYSTNVPANSAGLSVQSSASTPPGTYSIAISITGYISRPGQPIIQESGSCIGYVAFAAEAPSYPYPTPYPTPSYETPYDTPYGTPPGGEPGGYGLSCGPQLRSADPGGATTYTIDVTSQSFSFGNPVRVNVPNPPPGVSVDPIANFFQPQSRTAIVRVGSSVSPGDYAITFVGTMLNGPTRSATCNLHVNLAAFENNPQTLVFSAQRGAPSLPGAQNVTLSNTGDVPLNPITIVKSSGSNWLTVAPPSQTSLVIAGQSQVSVQPNTTNLAVGTYNATITFAHAMAGQKITNVQYIVTDIPPPPLDPPDFSMSCARSSGSGSIQPGQSATYDITITALNGFSGPVNVVLENSPNPTITASPISINIPPGKGAITVQTTVATPDGNYTLTFVGRGGGLTHSCNVLLSIGTIPPPPGDFSLDCGPLFRQVTIPGVTTYSVSISSTGSGSPVVDLSAQSNPGGAGSPQLVMLPTQVTAPGSSTLIVTADSNTNPGRYDITIFGKAGSIERTCEVELEVLTACPPVCPYVTPGYATPASQPDLSLSNKDVVAVNGVANPNADPSNGMADVPTGITFKAGDKVRFKINIYNTGTAAATNVRVEDRFTNLKLASPARVVFTGCSGSSTDTGVGINFRVNNSVGPGEICGIAFDSIIQSPSGARDGVYRLQNLAEIKADDYSITVRTPLLLFTVGRTPTKEEVAP